MKKLFLLCLIFILGCDQDSLDQDVANTMKYISYVHDSRIDQCFAGYSSGYRLGLATIDCKKTHGKVKVKVIGY